MTLREEGDELRRRLAELAGEADLGLLRRYDSRRARSHESLSAYRRFRMAVGRVLRRLGMRRASTPAPWLPGLKHFSAGDDARALVVWAIGADRDTIRAGCRGIEKLLAGRSGFAPVLITDVADFAFFSRLGWLVEYVPALSAPAENYAERKLRYLASRYSDASALPVSAGLKEHASLEEL